MPIDPNIPLQAQAPPAANPLDSLARVLQMKNAIAQQPLIQGQQQLQQQAIQEGQLRLDQTKAMNDAYKSAIVTGPDGTAHIDDGKLQQVLSQGPAAANIPAVMEGLTKWHQGVATLNKTKADLASAQADNAGAMAATVSAAPPEAQPSMLLMMAQHAVEAGTIDPATAAPYMKALTDAQAQDPTGAAAQKVTSQILEMLKQGSVKQQERATAAISAAGTAQRGQAAADQAATAAKREGAAETDRASSQAIGLLSAAPPADQAAYAQFLAKQTPEVRQRLTSVVPVEQYDPAKSPAMLNQSAMTPEQRFKANQPGTEKNPTEASMAYAAVKAAHPDWTEAQVNEGALQRLDQSKQAARPGQGADGAKTQTAREKQAESQAKLHEEYQQKEQDQWRLAQQYSEAANVPDGEGVNDPGNPKSQNQVVSSEARRRMWQQNADFAAKKAQSFAGSAKQIRQRWGWGEFAAGQGAASPGAATPSPGGAPAAAPAAKPSSAPLVAPMSKVDDYAKKFNVTRAAALRQFQSEGIQVSQ
jgi:hypothetical protein